LRVLRDPGLAEVKKKIVVLLLCCFNFGFSEERIKTKPE
jgi:hypothetical protein